MSTSDSDSKSKEKKKKKEKMSKKAKKEKKESKKAKKLAKQIKKLEDEVERRKRQMNGEVEEKKKKKKKKSSSSSSSSQSRKKAKAGANKDLHPEVVEDQDKALQPCPACSEEMLWSDLAEGVYTEDWWCDNIEKCGSSGSQSRTKWRWNCAKCTRDLCRECRGLPEGWIETEPKHLETEPAEAAESESSEESNPERHEGAECDHCEMCPIIGPRFKCTSCEDVSLCRICYKRRLEVHKPGHRFFAMKPMLGVSPDATEKLKEMKRKERDERDERENEEEENQGRDKEVQREDRQELKLEQSLAKSQQTHSVAITEQSSLQGMQVAFEDAQVAPSFLPIHFAPPVQPTDAPEVASKLQERWQNIGQDYKKSWQGQEPKKTKEQKAKDTKAEQITLRVGKQLLRGSKCGLCLQQVLDSASGVICFRKRPDGSEGGCGKGICFPCMLRASSMMFGKVRITKEIWVALPADKAWWMHERCMTASNDRSEFEEMIQSFGLTTKLHEASAELPKGWIRKISHTTGKVFYVNAKLGKAQWDLPAPDPQASPDASNESHKDDPEAQKSNGSNGHREDTDGNGADEEELVEL